ncbi:Ragulator complex protein lamtor3 [Dermatophagoides pteronyssinus]|uniref:Ragulator complex protein lamtor3 n=2 Tax=Dermatophagoides pteronyssinus TaxID=6956 RepID=A0ABQ8JHM1_DERPT|nr:ragulator complex protein LAMTOR3-A-like [Dermatophagoides pteronyssinus]KAH9421826.1 Ragulator complex protein lamtor3 [Dermatophagoides pteronyssinus]
MPGRNTIPDRSTTIPKTTGPSSSSANSPPLLEELDRELRTLLKHFDGIAAFICDREGAFLIKVLNDSKPDGIFLQSMLHQKLINSSENIHKMNLDAPSKILLEYDRYQIMQFFSNKFIVAFIASSQCPTGTLFALEPDSLAIFQILREHFD